MIEFWILAVLIAVLGVPFTLWWWKIGDRWADEEHKRFKPKAALPPDRVVVRKNATIDGSNAAPPRED